MLLKQGHRSVSAARCARSAACGAKPGGKACNANKSILYVAKCPLAEADQRTCTVLDFLPQDPLALRTALELLAGRSVQGTIRRHKFSREPPFPRHRLGDLRHDWQEDADAFCATFDSRLHLVNNDCKAFVSGLSEQLLGSPAPPLASLNCQLPKSQNVDTVGSMPDILDW